MRRKTFAKLMADWVIAKYPQTRLGATVMNVHQAAKALGIGGTTLHSWLNGYNWPPQIRRRRLAKQLRLHYDAVQAACTFSKEIRTIDRSTTDEPTEI